MRRLFLTLCLLLLVTGFVAGQDEPTPYEIALQRIEDARQSGATVLDLSMLGLTELPPEIGSLTTLNHLNLDGNQLTDLPIELGQLSSLQGLYLSGNQFTSLPPEIWQLTNLGGLTLAGNQLTSLPPEIGRLTQLYGLILGDNRLTSLPPEIGQLTQLVDFSLPHNQLTSLPPEIGQLTNLIMFNLSNNQLRRLPPELGNLNNFTCLNRCLRLRLENNPLISPPPEVVEQGTDAVLAYLRDEHTRQQAEKQRLILAGLFGIGLLVAFILGFRLKQRGRRKPKLKRDLIA